MFPVRTGEERAAEGLTWHPKLITSTENYPIPESVFSQKRSTLFSPSLGTLISQN